MEGTQGTLIFCHLRGDMTIVSHILPPFLCPIHPPFSLVMIFLYLIFFFLLLSSSFRNFFYIYHKNSLNILSLKQTQTNKNLINPFKADVSSL